MSEVVQVLDRNRITVTDPGPVRVLSSLPGNLAYLNVSQTWTGGTQTFQHVRVQPQTVDNLQALTVTVIGNTHGLVVNRTQSSPVNGNVLLVTAQDVGSDASPLDTTVGISGYELGKGTLKVSHFKPVANTAGSDANAAALSLRANGTGTAAQGIFFDAEDGGTTGKLMNFRNNGADRMILTPAGQLQLPVVGGGTTATAGLMIGAEFLFSSGAGVLRTNSQLTRVGSVFNQVVDVMTISGSSPANHVVYADGKHEWGSGAATRDTNLYRGGVNTLATDGGLLVTGVPAQSSNILTLNASGPTLLGEYTSAGVLRQWGPTGGTTEYATRVAGDTVDRFAILADGTLGWGPGGSSALDVSIVRAGANVLSLASKWQVNSSGQVHVGTGALPSTDRYLNVATTHVGGAAALYGAVFALTAPATSTTFKGTWSSIGTAAGTALTQADGYYAAGYVGMGAGASMATYSGFRATQHGGAGVTNAYGVFVEPQSGAATLNVGGRFDTSTTAALWLGGDQAGTAQSGGLVFGSGRDANLYRNGPGSLEMDQGAGTPGQGATLSVGMLNFSQTGATSMPNTLGSQLGDKIGLWTAAGAQYGIGVQSNTMVFYAPNVAGVSMQFRRTNATAPWSGGGAIFTFNVNNAIFTLTDGGKIDGGSTTGTQIMTASTRKLAFFGATPVVQPSGTPAAATDLATVISLANSLRASLVALGLVA